MSTSEGTNTTTGTVEPTRRQLLASDNQLAKLLVKQNVAAEKIRDDVLAKIDEIIGNGAWRVAFDAESKPFENLRAYLAFRLAPVATLAALISRPVAERLLLLEDDKGKRVNTVRDVEAITGVSRGLLDKMNQAEKQRRNPRPNDGTTDTNDSGEQETEARIAAKKAVKRVPGTVKAVTDTMDEMTAEELVNVAYQFMAAATRIAEMFKVAGHGDFKAAIEVVRAEAAKEAAKVAPAA